MKKKPMILLFILLAVTSCLLLWQWRSYSGVLEENSEYKFEHPKQRITIETAGKEMQITQTVTGLIKDKNYQIIRPDSLFRWQCIDDDGESCKSYNVDSSKVIAENGELNFTYVIPIPEQPAYILTDWTTRIKDSSIMETTIDIVEKERRGSTWVAGMPQTGYEKLSLIDFYSFKGKGDTPSLYWQSDTLEKKVLNEGLSIQGNPFSIGKHDLQSAASLEQDEYLAVIFTDAVKPAEYQGIKIISPASSAEDIERELINDYFMKKFTKLSNQEKWIIDFLTSLTREKAPAAMKSEIMMAELSQSITNEERNTFVHALQKTKRLDFTILDQLLGDMKGLKTSFFSINKDENSELTPLLFMDPRKVIINDKVTDVTIAYRQDKILFPFVDTLKAMGFRVDTEESTFYASNKTDQFTFFLAQPIFTRNGTDFGLLENPLQVEGGQVYIGIEALQPIFHAEIIENPESIQLNYAKNEK